MTETIARPRGRASPAAVAAAASAGVTRPDDPRLRAWVAFLQAHAVVTRHLEAELRAEQQLSLAEYDALVQLAIADDHRLRMSELADRVVLSRSGITRLVDRLVAEGLVGRRACPTDARVAWAELTPSGLSRLRDAAPVHLRGVDAYFLSLLDQTGRDALAESLEAVVRGVRAPDELAPPECTQVAEALEP
jgi:DNA-binding MarR family transcriptional regulator